MTTDIALTPNSQRLPQDYLGEQVDAKAVEQALLIGDMSQMSDSVRIQYYIATCRSVGLNPLTRPFQALKGDDGKVTLYADKGCAEQLRKKYRVSTRVISRETIEDLYIVTVLATLPDGRAEEAQAIVPISKPQGKWEDYEYRGEKKRRFRPELDTDGREVLIRLSATERATAMMKCETKAKRRVTLAICGLGLADADERPTEGGAQEAGATWEETEYEAAKTHAEHIADVYGPDMSTAQLGREMPRMEAMVAPPVSRSVADSAPADTAALRQEIDDWQEAHGMTSQQRMYWRGQHVRRLKAKSFAHLSREVLLVLWADLQEEDPDEDDTQTVSAWTVGAAGATVPAWREALAQGAAHLREFLGGDGQSADQREAILELTTHALALAEDPDATEAAGQGCLTAMRQLGDDVARQLGLPL